MKIDHDGTRTRNLLIRSQTPYPLGHAADENVTQDAFYKERHDVFLPDTGHVQQSEQHCHG